MPEMTVLPLADPDLEPLPEKRSLSARLVTLVAILVPLIAVLAAPFFVWGWGFGWTDLALLVAMYLLTALGITVGFHRLFVHRSFETYMWVKVCWAVLGSMAVQGSLLKWVGMHRRHHQHSDTAQDPHSPQPKGRGLRKALRAFWHAHLGWFFQRNPDLDRYGVDLRRSRTLRIVSALFPLWVALGLLIPAAIGGLVTQSWAGMWSGLIWGGLVRVFLVHHVTWSVNSACHLWGAQPYRSTDESRNNPVFGVLALGEGWHNTHHAFPTSARHGLQWWQIDVSYWVIRLQSLLGLAWNVRLPTREARAESLRSTPEPHTNSDSGDVLSRCHPRDV